MSKHWRYHFKWPCTAKITDYRNFSMLALIVSLSASKGDAWYVLSVIIRPNLCFSNCSTFLAPFNELCGLGRWFSTFFTVCVSSFTGFSVSSGNTVRRSSILPPSCSFTLRFFLLSALLLILFDKLPGTFNFSKNSVDFSLCLSFLLIFNWCKKGFTSLVKAEAFWYLLNEALGFSPSLCCLDATFDLNVCFFPTP